MTATASSLLAVPDQVLLQTFCSKDRLVPPWPCAVTPMVPCLDSTCRRVVLPLVCKRWSNLLRAPLQIWESVACEFEFGKSFSLLRCCPMRAVQWLTLRSASVRSLALAFYDRQAAAAQEVEGWANASMNAKELLVALVRVVAQQLEELMLLDDKVVVVPSILSALPRLAALRKLHLYKVPEQTILSAELGDLLNQLEWLDSLEITAASTSFIDHDGLFFPSAVVSLRNLANLRLSSRLVSCIDEGISSLTCLTRLLLPSCSICMMPHAILSITTLRALSLRDNVAVGEVPEDEFWPFGTMPSLSSLLELDLGNCRLQQVPSFVPLMTSVRALSLCRNARLGPWLKSVSPRHFEPLSHTLQELDLSWCNLEVYPPSLLGFTALTALHIDGNCLSELPSEFSSLSSLRYLGLSSNHFSELPTVLSRLELLEVTNMQSNHLLQIKKSITWLLSGTSFKCLDLRARMDIRQPFLERRCSSAGLDAGPCHDSSGTTDRSESNGTESEHSSSGSYVDAELARWSVSSVRYLIEFAVELEKRGKACEGLLI